MLVVLQASIPANLLPSLVHTDPPTPMPQANHICEHVALAVALTSCKHQTVTNPSLKVDFFGRRSQINSSGTAFMHDSPGPRGSSHTRQHHAQPEKL